MKKIFWIMLKLLIILMSFQLIGCGYSDSPPSVIKVRNESNTFGLNHFKTFLIFPKEETVVNIKVYGADDYLKEKKDIYWQINAVKLVSSIGFKVTVGDVPKDFEQIVPLPEEKFQPVRGRSYVIDFDLKDGFALPLRWVAE